MRAGPALDWRVAKTLGINVEIMEDGPYHNGAPYNPSSNWAIGGPFMDEYRLTVGGVVNKYEPHFVQYGFNQHGHVGDTVLAAICTAVIQNVKPKDTLKSKCPYPYEDTSSFEIKDEKWVSDHPGYDLGFRDIISEYLEIGREEFEKELKHVEEAADAPGYSKSILRRVDYYIKQHGEQV